MSFSITKAYDMNWHTTKNEFDFIAGLPHIGYDSKLPPHNVRVSTA